MPPEPAPWSYNRRRFQGDGQDPVALVEVAASAETDFRIGERGSAKVAGFDFGNSPTEFVGYGIPPDSTVALSTTNGTRIVEAAGGARAILLAPSSGVPNDTGGYADLRPGGQHKKPKLVLDKGVMRHYSGVSEGGSNVTSSVESATGRR